MNKDRHSGLFADKTHRAVGPVHVFAFQVRNVALACAQVPAQLIKYFPFGVHFGGDDLLVFFKSDCPFLFEAHLVISSIGICQVRVAISESMAARYVRAIWRFRTGCRNDSFLAFSRMLASASSLVRRLS